MKIFQGLAAVVVLCCLSQPSQAAIQLLGHDPVSNSFFDVFVDLVDVLITGPPIVPVHDLGDPTHPRFTTMVDQ